MLPLAALAILIVAQVARAEERVLRNSIVIHTTMEKAWQVMTTSDGMKAWSVRAQIENGVRRNRQRKRSRFPTMVGFQIGREWDLLYNFFNRANDSELNALKKYIEKN
jgi:hypothetical protein